MPFESVVPSLLTSLVLQVVLAAVALYALYRVVRKAVAHGIRDARRVEAKVPSSAG